MESIGKQYNNTDIEGKRLLLGSIFPNKIHFENKKVRTADVNPILNEIASINKACRGIKKWDKSKKLDLSHMVISEGFEPSTYCLEGSCSIQLSYETLQRKCLENCRGWSRLQTRRTPKVGVAGFEPATSWSQTRRDNRATLHPEFPQMGVQI